MKNHLWKLVGVVALLAMLIAAVPLAADEHAAVPVNSLRLYGEGEHGTFPYETYMGPFALPSEEAPHKDFAVFNPAIITDRPDLADPLGLLGRRIKASNADAFQKVHARMWYDPARPEPIGDTHPMVRNPDTFADIVFEYTYILLDDQTHHPTSGGSAAMGQNTQLVFPMAGLGGAIGLDRFDIGPYQGINEPVEPASPEMLRLEAVTRGVNDAGGDDLGTTDSTIVVSPQPTAGPIRLKLGQWIEFFDYAVKVTDEPTSQELKVEVAIYYTGYQKDNWRFVGNASLWLGDAASAEARFGSVTENWSEAGWRAPEPVIRPFWVEATHVGTDYVSLKPYRYLQTGETFFVDGAEYDVAAIYTEGPDCPAIDCGQHWPNYCWEPVDCGRSLKYITIQSPLPKGDGTDVNIKNISVWKRTVRKDTSLPMLPPFNMVHDEVDDTNIPNCASGPDTQFPDNVGVSPCKTPDYLDPRYDTIVERIMLDMPAYNGDSGPESFIAWIDQTKEDRFDTNLFEEKWTEPGWVTKYPVKTEAINFYRLATSTDDPAWADLGFAFYGPTSHDMEQVLGVTVNGEPVPIIFESPGKRHVLLEQDFGTATVEITYIYKGDTVYEGEQLWRWINIETKPWNYTEFTLPLRRDVTDPLNQDGDYIVVSSWKTQDDVRMKFAYDAAATKVHSADIYVNDAEYNVQFREGLDANSLRVYGHKYVTGDSPVNPYFDAAFPYTLFDGPFNLDHTENTELPEKDFIVHNPALLDHFDFDSFDGLYNRIFANEDAHQKVHLRTWYVPTYPEPRGPVWFEEIPADYGQQFNPLGDIVNEYTYLLLEDDTYNPRSGSKQRTQLVFPMASGSGLGVDNPQVGLDRYDLNNDGTHELMTVEYIRQFEGGLEVCSPPVPTTDGEIVVSAAPTEFGNMRLYEGGRLEFFDYMIKLYDTSTSELKADLEVWYMGERYDEPVFLDQITLWQEVANAAVVDAGTWTVNVSFDRHFENIPFDKDWEGQGMKAIDRPFGFRLTHVSNEYVSIQPYRILKTGETMWVDGAQYDVAALGIVPGEYAAAHGCDLAELKYITIRNPIPKGEGEFYLPKWTVWKTRFGELETLPVLPPFNHTHDIVDDVNVPETCAFGPDVQRPDNPATDTCVPADWKTIPLRRVQDVDALEFYYIAEEKEERFDTSLTEEKWKYTTDCNTGQCWQWINIETMPWHFTEFVLPEIPQARVGNYLLVSSFITQDEVRVKFAYDPTDGTGLYVNSDLCEPARVTGLDSNSPVEQYATIELEGAVNAATMDFTWDFGDLTGCTGEGTLEPTCPGNVAGTFEVCLIAENDCPSRHEVCTDVVVEACLGDFEAPFGFRDLADILAMLPYWNLQCSDDGWDDAFDLTGDCRVGLADVIQVVAVWNTTCPGGTP